MFTCIHPFTTGLNTINGDIILQERVEQTNSVGATSHTSHQGIRQLTRLCQNLFPRFATDNALEVTYQQGVRMRASQSPYNVESVMHVGHPIAHRVVPSIF